MAVSSFCRQSSDSTAQKTHRKFDMVLTGKSKEIKERKINDSVLNQLKRDNAFWYANVKPLRIEQANQIPLWFRLVSQEWFKVLIWLLIAGGFATVLIWYLVSLEVHLFKKTPKSLTSPAYEEGADIFTIDYDAEIKNAVQQQNYRLAIRLYYLQLLKELAQRNMIQYQTGFTNADYIRQLSTTNYYKTFFRLTRHFEYCWYGQMPINSANFNMVQHDFETFKQQLHP